MSRHCFVHRSISNRASEGGGGAAAGARGTARDEAPPPTSAWHGHPHAAGVSLIECLIVVAIIGVLLAGAVPGSAQWLARHRASTAVNDFAHAIALARGEALRRSRRVYVAPPTGHWRDGWAVFVDNNDNRAFDALDKGGAIDDETIATHDRLSASITIANTSGSSREPFTDVGRPQRVYLMFDGSGAPRQRNGGFNAGGIVFTARVGNATSTRALCLGSFGRWRIVADRTTC